MPDVHVARAQFFDALFRVPNAGRRTLIAMRANDAGFFGPVATTDNIYFARATLFGVVAGMPMHDRRADDRGNEWVARRSHDCRVRWIRRTRRVRRVRRIDRCDVLRLTHRSEQARNQYQAENESIHRHLQK